MLLPEEELLSTFSPEREEIETRIEQEGSLMWEQTEVKKDLAALGFAAIFFLLSITGEVLGEYCMRAPYFRKCTFVR